MTVETSDSLKKHKKTKKEKKAMSSENGLPKESIGTLEMSDLNLHDTPKKEKKRKRKEADVNDTADEPLPKKARKDANANEASPSEAKLSKEERKRRKKEAKEALEATSSAVPERVQSFLTKNAITIHGDVTPILDFSQIDIPAALMETLSKFKEPTPIQACSWPPLLAGRDVVGIAETGSGKTLAFGIPALARLAATERPPKGQNINVLVVAPTRELAIQTHDTLLAAGKPLGITSVCLYGGTDKEAQKKSLKDKKLRIVVGTPGRLLDLANEGACSFEHVSFLVLDEADRMLDKGFENDIRKIIGMTAQDARQTLMFSATWPDSVRRLAASFQKDPVRITVGQDDLTANHRVEQVIDVFDDPREKDSKLLKILKQVQKKSITPGSDESRTLVFVLYKNEAPRVEQLLRGQGYSVCVLHGNVSQDARLKALNDFKTGKVGVLIATDVAARGLDIPNVGTVINYTFPLTVEDYVHRIGRTGRGGREGKSVTFFTGEKHEKALAGELAKVVRESGFDAAAEGLRQRFDMTIKKKTHNVYGAHFKEIDSTVKGTKIVFD
ncbi:related to DBP3-Putative RNA helicase required for pre-rRNA processing [Serendipita indica DSM 11827]|uniref:RNA helicase n=1 Tax=Serendipita indica (strain DSM 11827) TaxID=1109443 RepID=G4TRF8_SERID|nr:related to DBP3-Putative RNA helicase required for pre-rRNA processing [Serendipita indica DSM 11827]